MCEQYDEVKADREVIDNLLKEIAKFKKESKNVIIVKDGLNNLYKVNFEDLEPIDPSNMPDILNELNNDQNRLNADLSLLNGGNAASNQDQPSQPVAPVDQPVQPQPQVDPNGNPIPPADPNAQPALDPNPVVPPIQ